MQSNDPRIAKWASGLLVLSVFAACLWIIFFGQFIADDAFIIFRYGKTLRLAHTWNWNPTGDRVEAYTGSLYAVFAVLAQFSDISPVLLVKVIGLSSILGMTFILFRSATCPALAYVAPSLLLLNPYTWVHASSGLETPVFMLLLLGIGALTLNIPGRNDPRLLYLLAILLPFTRPEGAVFSCVAIWWCWKKTPAPLRRLPTLAVLVALAGSYFLVRWRYFHYLLPNPFYVKVSGFSLEASRLNLLHNAMLFAALASVSILNPRREYRAFVGAGFLVIALLYLPHSLAMNYCERFFFQVAFPLVLLGVASIPAGRTLPSWAIPGVMTFVLLSINPNEPRGVLTWAPYLENAHFLIGKSLAPFASEGHTLLLGDAGSIPYFAGWKTFDYLGLCSSTIAHHGFRAEDLEKMHPDVILVYSQAPDALSGNESNQQRLIAEYMSASGNYVLAGHVKWSQFYLLEYIRSDQEHANEIKDALESANRQNAAFQFHLWDVIDQRYLLSELSGD